MDGNVNAEMIRAIIDNKNNISSHAFIPVFYDMRTTLLFNKLSPDVHCVKIIFVLHFPKLVISDCETKTTRTGTKFASKIPVFTYPYLPYHIYPDATVVLTLIEIARCDFTKIHKRRQVKSSFNSFYSATLCVARSL